MMKKLVLVHGYARSGKTTLLSKLREFGYQTLSTSIELDWLVLESVGLSRYFLQVLREKDDEALSKELGYPITCRELKIDVAENRYIPKYGRTALIKRTFEEQYNPHHPLCFVFFETLGGEEAEIVRDVWQGYGLGTVDLNLRSDRELKGVDIRELSPDGIEIQNLDLTPTELAVDVLNLVAVSCTLRS